MGTIIKKQIRLQGVFVNSKDRKKKIQKHIDLSQNGRNKENNGLIEIDFFFVIFS